MILGIGTDFIEKKRVEKIFKKYFIQNLDEDLTPNIHQDMKL